MIQNYRDKVKRGQSYLLDGVTVWVERQTSKMEAMVCFNEARGLEDEYKNVKIADLKPTKKTGSSIKQVVKPVSKDEREYRESLNEFFDRVSLKIPFRCENCSKPLYAYNKKAKRSVCCHLLPKSIFKSIATDEANIVFMGADFIGCPCSCHDQYDSNADKRSTMPIYTVALHRFETDLKFKLTPQELKQAFTYLKIEWQ